MSLFALKLIALITMTIDHTGRFFFPTDIGWLLVGRLAFPIFAWGIANGYHYTRNVEQYMLRLGIFAVISQIPFTISFIVLGYNPSSLNIFFTLLLGLLAIYTYERIPYQTVGWGGVLLLSLLASVVQADYGLYGVLLTFVFHLTYANPRKMLVGQASLWLVLYIFALLIPITPLHEISMLRSVPRLVSVQLVALFSVLLIAYYNGVQGPKMKWLFYWYYPLHLVVLWLLAVILL